MHVFGEWAGGDSRFSRTAAFAHYCDDERFAHDRRECSVRAQHRFLPLSLFAKRTPRSKRNLKRPKRSQPQIFARFLKVKKHSAGHSDGSAICFHCARISFTRGTNRSVPRGLSDSSTLNL